MIIGLTGLKGSGKDTVGAYLIKEHNFQRRAFADPGKRYMAEVLDIPYHEIENFKNDETVFVTTGNKNKPAKHIAKSTLLDGGIAKCDECGEHVLEDEVHIHGPDAMWSPIREQTFRQFMQTFIENAKHVFGEDVWVNATLPVGGFYSGKSIVITDLRFENEAQRIRDLGGFIVRIENPSLVDQDPHRRENEQLGITPHYKIVNDRSIEFLYQEIEFMLEGLV